MENEGLEGGKYLCEPDTRHVFVKELGSTESIQNTQMLLLCFSVVC